MKHFVVYTVLRMALFVATFGVLSLAIVPFVGRSSSVWFVLFVLAAVISSLLSLRLLAGPRERFAGSVEARAARAREKFEEIRSSEDVDEA